MGVGYLLGGRLVQKSLRTDNLRLARDKLKQIEYDLAVGNLHAVTRLPLPAILEGFCRHMVATRTHKSWKNDLSRLRVFFGPVCEALKPGTPGVPRKAGSPKATPDRYAGKHVQAKLLEDVTSQAINRFITERVEQDGWEAKTANLTRATLHRLFVYAIKHHGFVSRDRRYPNPVALHVSVRLLPSRFPTGTFSAMTWTPFHFLIVAISGWMNREQQQVIDYLREENRILREKLGRKRTIQRRSSVMYPLLLVRCL